MTDAALQANILSSMQPGKSYLVDDIVDRILDLHAIDRDSAVDAVLVMIEQGYLAYDDNQDVTVRGKANGLHVGPQFAPSAHSRAG